MKTGRYSGYIRPFTYNIDLIIINLLNYYLLNSVNGLYSHIFISITWLVISWNTGYYEVYRFTKLIDIISKIIKQFVFFTILNFAYAGFFSKKIDPYQNLTFVMLVIIFTSIVKLYIYYFLKFYRIIFEGNFRNVIVVGNKNNTSELIHFFNENTVYGYKLIREIDLDIDKEKQIQECFNFILSSKIDEIYCSIADLNEEQISQFEEFSDRNLKTLKFIPDSKKILVRNAKLDYLGYIPIIPLRSIALDNPTNRLIKRFFDVLFSLCIVVFILPWLTIIVAIFIKLESKGPVFFKQKRNGLNYHEFYCYKFRSLHVNENADKQLITKNDSRITNVGKFIRKTNIDEMPQFVNVLLGDMSVVGPRPQMLSVNEDYLQRIDKFMVRHYIKPGITGLAQTSGYRGEVSSENDIINRVKFDIFYIENWSFLLDLKIIFNTIFNTLVGDKKAY